MSELANLKRANLDWQTHRLMIYGKGGPYGVGSLLPETEIQTDINLEYLV